MLWLKKIFSRRQRREKIWQLLTGNAGTATAEMHEKVVVTTVPAPSSTRESQAGLPLFGRFLQQVFRFVGIATTSVATMIIKTVGGVLGLFEFAVWLVFAGLLILLLLVLLQHFGINLPFNFNVFDLLKNIQEVFSR